MQQVYNLYILTSPLSCGVSVSAHRCVLYNCCLFHHWGGTARWCVFLCVCVCVHLCVCLCVCGCVYVQSVCVFHGVHVFVFEFLDSVFFMEALIIGVCVGERSVN